MESIKLWCNNDSSNKNNNTLYLNNMFHVRIAGNFKT